MHAITFSLRRADLRAIAFQRALLESFGIKAGITPARYLMLYVIARAHFDFILQSTIVKELGVSAATVSVMLRSLEALGYVRRSMCLSDRRTKYVKLTRKGRGVIHRVAKRIIRPGIMWMAIYSIFDMDGAGVGKLEFALHNVRRHFLDRAQFFYPDDRRTLYPERRFKPPPPFRWPGFAFSAAA